MFEEALESRLRVIEEEISRLTRLASEEFETEKQDNYLHLAQDLQREARELRSLVKHQAESRPAVGSASTRRWRNRFPILFPA